MDRTPTIVLTGGSSGLGRLAAIELADRGARLVLIARDETRIEGTVSAIRAVAPAAEVDVHLADLSSIPEVARVGRTIAAAYPVIDVLVANAGVHAFSSRATGDGYPEMVAVNYLAPWLLTRLLLPSILRAEAGRVVVVASEASRRHGVLELPEDLTRVTAFTARGSSEHYGRSKLLDIMFALELARRIEGSRASAICLDPGFNVTGLGREVPGARVVRRVLGALRIGDPARGAGLIVSAADDAAFAHRNGEYWTVRGPRRIDPVAPADDPALRARLWADTELLLGA